MKNNEFYREAIRLLMLALMIFLLHLLMSAFLKIYIPEMSNVYLMLFRPVLMILSGLFAVPMLLSFAVGFCRRESLSGALIEIIGTELSGSNFSEFLNEYRVERALENLRLLMQPGRQSPQIEDFSSYRAYSWSKDLSEEIGRNSQTRDQEF